MDNEMDFDTGSSGNAVPSSNEMDYGGAATGMLSGQSGGDSWNALISSYASNPIAAGLGISTVQTWLAPSPIVGDVGPAGGASKTEDKGFIRNMLDGFKNLKTDEKQMWLTAATLLAGGVAGIGENKRKQQAADALTLNAQSSAARVAEEKRQFDIKNANASSIGQTNFNTAMLPTGAINPPVTLARNRLLPTHGATA